MASRRGGRRILPSLGAGLALASALALAVLLPGRPPARAGDGPPPADDPAADGLLAAAAASRAIDREIDRALAEAGLEPTGPSDDAEFLRRLSLDMLGVPPTEGEVLAFLASRDPSKRAAKVEELLAHPLHFDHAADLWGRLLFAGLRRYRSEERGRVQAWLAEGFRAGRGLDDLARDLVTASGNTNDDPALAYVLRFRDGGIPADIAGTTSRIFLGVQIQCAQCHDHPYERWKQGEFAGFAAFFNLVNPRPADPEDRRKGFVVEDPGLRQLERSRGRGGEGADIRGAARAAPRFLGGGEWTDREGTTRREALADWMLSRENPFFAKAMVNRVWSWWFGRGLVNPVDDFRSDNPPSHPALLETLALGLAESGYDQRFLLRAIAGSRAYGRTSRLPPGWEAGAPGAGGGGGGEGEAAREIALRRFDRAYGRGPVKPLTADQVFDSVLRVTGMDDAFRRANRAEIERVKEGLLRQFVSEIGDDETGESEQWAGSIPQGLLLMNGPLTQAGTRASGPAGRGDRVGILARENTLRKVLDEEKDAGARVGRLYLAALGRRPSAEEVREAAAFASRGKSDRGWEDLLWALLNGSEFMSNH